MGLVSWNKEVSHNSFGSFKIALAAPGWALMSSSMQAELCGSDSRLAACGVAPACRHSLPGKGFGGTETSRITSSDSNELRLQNKGSSRALRTPSLFMAASPPPLPSHLGAAGKRNPAGSSHLLCAQPCPLPALAGGGGWQRARSAEGINRRPEGSGPGVCRCAGRRLRGWRQSGHNYAGRVPPPLSSPVRTWLPAATPEARWRVNAAGPRAYFSAFSASPGLPPQLSAGAPQAAAAGRAPSRPGREARGRREAPRCDPDPTRGF